MWAYTEPHLYLYFSLQNTLAKFLVQNRRKLIMKKQSCICEKGTQGYISHRIVIYSISTISLRLQPSAPSDLFKKIVLCSFTLQSVLRCASKWRHSSVMSTHLFNVRSWLIWLTGMQFKVLQFADVSTHWLSSVCCRPLLWRHDMQGLRCLLVAFQFFKGEINFLIILRIVASTTCWVRML